MGETTQPSETIHPVVGEPPLNNSRNNNQNNNRGINNLANNNPPNNYFTNNLLARVPSEREDFNFYNNNENENGANPSMQTSNAPAIPDEPSKGHGAVQQSATTAEPLSNANSPVAETRPVPERRTSIKIGQVPFINDPDVNSDERSPEGDQSCLSSNLATQPLDTQPNQPTTLLGVQYPAPLLRFGASDEGAALELQPANSQRSTARPLEHDDNPIAIDPPAEPPQLTQVANHPASEHAVSARINPQGRRADLEILIRLRNMANQLAESAPEGSFKHEMRKLMAPQAESILQLFDSFAQRAHSTTRTSDEKPVSQPAASRPSQQNDQCTLYSLPVYLRHHSEPRGLCLILNMVTFVKPADRPALRERLGSRADVTNLTLLFQDKLRYKVVIKENLGKAELLKCITLHLQLDLHAKADAFVVFIMSHGMQEAIICSDGESVKYSDIVDLLSQQQCAHLQGKSKLAFIQACQGVKDQIGTFVPAEFWSRTNVTPGRPSMLPSPSTTASFRSEASAASSSSSSTSSTSAYAFTAHGLTETPSGLQPQVSQDDRLNLNVSIAPTSSTLATRESQPAQPVAPIQPAPDLKALGLDSPIKPGSGSGDAVVFIPARVESEGVDDPASVSGAAISANAAIASSIAATSLAAFSASEEAAAEEASAASVNPRSSAASDHSTTQTRGDRLFTFPVVTTPDVITRRKSLLPAVAALTKEVIGPAPRKAPNIGTPFFASPLSLQAFTAQRLPLPPSSSLSPSGSSTSLNSSGSHWTHSTSSSVAQQPIPWPGPSGRRSPFGTEDSHSVVGSAPAPAHPEPLHTNFSSPFFRPSNTPTPFSAPSHEDDDDERNPALRGSSHDDTGEQHQDTCIPTHGSDILIGLSSVPDYASALHDRHGSWYIRALCEVFNKHAGLPPNGLDILDMLTLVNYLVANTNGETADKRFFKQMPCIWYNTLRCKFYFELPTENDNN